MTDPQTVELEQLTLDYLNGKIDLPTYNSKTFAVEQSMTPSPNLIRALIERGFI
jgi:hypothetical protein